MKQTPALAGCLLMGVASTSGWASEVTAPDTTPFFLERLGLNTPSALPLYPSGLMVGRGHVFGESRFLHGDSHATVPNFMGISLAAAPYIAPGVWLDAGRFGVEAMENCASISGAELACGTQGAGNYLVPAIGTNANSIGLEARDDKSGGLIAGFASRNDALDMSFAGSHLRREEGSDWLVPTKDTEVFVGLGASSLPGARKKQRTELSWLYKDNTSAMPGSEFVQKSDRQRLQLSHSAQTGDSRRTDTRLFYQETGFRTFLADMTAMPASQDKYPGDFSGKLGDSQFHTYGIVSESLDRFGSHAIGYRLAYQRDGADYLLADEIISDSASVLDLGVRARFGFDWLDIDMDALWRRADLARDSGEAGTDFRAEGWHYGVGLWFADERIALRGEHRFAPPSPGNLEALSQSADHLRLTARWPLGDLQLHGELWYQTFDNLHFDCTEYSDCETVRGVSQFNAGEVDAEGLSLGLQWSGQLGMVKMPLSIQLEENRTRFASGACLEQVDFCWQEGDRVPWQPERQVTLAMGMEAGEWSLSVTGRDSEFADENQRRIDVSINWQRGAHQVYLRGDNVSAEPVSMPTDFGPMSGEVLVSLGYRWHG
ncbi:hypothetical protein [Shewanella litorisediminis]|uniref:TonB-dependent receptor n=1 Tax=Shewanella litorisediminis TaxID=1173586 RepID=A0ABX7G0L9_9GAMM|nr:hypothetical protein [Shewanella litorisediminis]MCL2918119.1 hypothetical protein [Shewanella litorisediminis]QRH00823.1 hypothetical protein JQC75_13170 [Shewanella litorisediminis]